MSKNNPPKGICLDLGCGPDKSPVYHGMNSHPGPGVDQVWDLSSTPYPLEESSCLTILSRYVVTRLAPGKFIDVMNEWHRLLQPKGRLNIIAVYGMHPMFIQDPMNTKPVDHTTWFYFAPLHPSKFWFKYRPKPWKIILDAWNNNGTVEVSLEKIEESDLLVDEKKREAHVNEV